LPQSRSSTAAQQLGLLLGAFIAGTLVARAFGADWGPASAFGQMAFAATLVTLLLRAS
jgi:hypothetical protein